MRSSKAAVLLLAVLMLLPWARHLTGQQAAPALPDIKTLGPQVGSRVPDFTLPDQTGTPRTLRSLMGPSGLLLLFYRSADWCPYCKTQLADMQARLPEVRRQGLGIAAVSYDPVPILADFTARRSITFPLLSDAGSVTIRKYGIINTTIPRSNTQSYGIPFPGTFVLDRDGVVKARFFEQAYQERVTVGSILARLGNGGDVPATEIRSAQLDVTSYLTDTVAAPGSHFSIVLDVVPAPGMHVYAPGVSGYKPIALSLTPAAGTLVRAAQYPAPETYVFQPLNEKVSVYQHRFRIVQDIAVDPSPEAAATLKDQQTLTLRGTLAYQACDDRVCFAPQSVPLAWTIALRQLDRQRATK